MSEHWSARAKCANDPVVQAELKNRFDRFHDTREGGNQAEAIKEYCGGCPVRSECLQEALRLQSSPEFSDDAFGYWGGTTKKQRSFHLNKQKKQKVQIVTDVQSLLERMKEQFPGTETPTEDEVA